jgi:hypothetical protein
LSKGGVGRDQTRVESVDLSARDVEFFFGMVNGNPCEHEDYMGEANTEGEIDENDELVTVEGFELATVHVPRNLLTDLYLDHRRIQ